MTMLPLPVILVEIVAATTLIDDYLAEVRPVEPAQVVAAPVIVHRHHPILVLPPATPSLDAFHHDDFALRADDFSRAIHDVSVAWPALNDYRCLNRGLGSERRCDE